MISESDQTTTDLGAILMLHKVIVTLFLSVVLYKTQIVPRLRSHPLQLKATIAESETTKTYSQPRKVMVLIPSRDDKLDSFYMDATEVTVGQFQKFLAETHYPFDSYRWQRIQYYSPTDNHPMVSVSWHEATAYAKWAGKSLPTEAEWEHAARGGLVNTTYLWGNDKKLARSHANFRGIGGTDHWKKKPSPVGSFAPNGYGLYDMAGNVWEWCEDWRDNSQVTKVLRGGSWYNFLYHLRIASRDSDHPTDTPTNVGFRCVSKISLDDWFDSQY